MALDLRGVPCTPIQQKINSSGGSCVNREDPIVVPRLVQLRIPSSLQHFIRLSFAPVNVWIYTYLPIWGLSGDAWRDLLVPSICYSQEYLHSTAALPQYLLASGGIAFISAIILLVLDSGDAGPSDWKPGCTAFILRVQNYIFAYFALSPILCSPSSRCHPSCTYKALSSKSCALASAAEVH